MKHKVNKEDDLNDVSIFIEANSDVIDKVSRGEITHICLDINEDNQNLILENIDGNLTLFIDETPERYQGCNLYNGGVFPYEIRESLEFVILHNDDEGLLTHIISVDVNPGRRCIYHGVGKPIVEDPEGDGCVWEVAFEIVPVVEEPKYYLMRWNPSISSFTEKDYKKCVKDMVHGMFRLNWSINEWEEAHRGDIFYMMRVGDDKAGIMFKGQFVSDPYPDEDWNGTTKRRMYVDMVCMKPIKLGAKSHLSLDKLQKAIPEIEWSKGHSGVLLPKEVVDKLHGLASNEYVCD